MRTSRRLLLATLLLVLGTFGTSGGFTALGPASPAGAHEGPGILTVETEEPTATGHRYVIRLVWQNDGHPAARDTTVTATPFAPDGTPQTPIAMTPVDDDGRFEATVETPEPGSWRLQFTSVSPVATVDHPVEVAAPPSTATTASAPSEDAEQSDASSDAAASGSANDDAEADPTASEASGDDGSGGAVALVLVLAGIVAAAAIAGYLALRRRKGDVNGGPAAPPATEAADHAGHTPASDTATKLDS